MAPRLLLGTLDAGCYQHKARIQCSLRLFARRTHSEDEDGRPTSLPGSDTVRMTLELDTSAQGAPIFTVCRLLSNRFLFAYAYLVEAANLPDAASIPARWKTTGSDEDRNRRLRIIWNIANDVEPFRKAALIVPNPFTCSKQANMSDCGVFVIATVKAISKHTYVRRCLAAGLLILAVRVCPTGLTFAAGFLAVGCQELPLEPTKSLETRRRYRGMISSVAEGSPTGTAASAD